MDGNDESLVCRMQHSYVIFNLNLKHEYVWNKLFSRKLMIFNDFVIANSITSTYKVTTADEGKKNHCYFSVY